MAGAAYTAGPLLVSHPSDFVGSFPIKSGEIINEGDLVGVDSNGQMVVATKAATAVRALGAAFFDDANGTGDTTRTGVAALTVRASIARKMRIRGLTTSIVPALNNGLPVFLGEVPDGTASNYTCTRSTTDTDAIQQVGFARSATEIDVQVEGAMDFLYQTAANSVTRYG